MRLKAGRKGFRDVLARCMEVLIFCLIFAKILPNANDQKEYRLMVVIVFRLHRRFDSCYCRTLGMADAHPSFPMHFFC